LVEKHPGYPQELMLWTDTQDWYWHAGSEDSPDTIHPVQPRCLGITKVLINTCMLDRVRSISVMFGFNPCSGSFVDFVPLSENIFH
jgi:hypothetical protein